MNIEATILIRKLFLRNSLENISKNNPQKNLLKQDISTPKIDIEGHFVTVESSSFVYDSSSNSPPRLISHNSKKNPDCPKCTTCVSEYALLPCGHLFCFECAFENNMKKKCSCCDKECSSVVPMKS
tara:strand:+ start:9985 stop:10362 length:378 start_codon:yes stop_codon:yes gene_type:complete